MSEKIQARANHAIAAVGRPPRRAAPVLEEISL